MHDLLRGDMRVAAAAVSQAVRAVAADEPETPATVVHPLTSGRVRLNGEVIRAVQDPMATANAV